MGGSDVTSAGDVEGGSDARLNDGMDWEAESRREESIWREEMGVGIEMGGSVGKSKLVGLVQGLVLSIGLDVVGN